MNTGNSPAIADDLIEALVPGGRLVSVKQLHGGVSYLTRRVQIAQPDDTVTTVVVRAPHAGADRACLLEREFATLQLARRLDLPAAAPLLLYREDNRATALVVAYVQGHMVVVIDDPQAYARRSAEVLASIHAAPVTAVDIAHLPPARASLKAWLARAPAEPDETLQESRVRAALAGAGSVPSPANGVKLLHGDFWPGNIMWHNGTISGVLDWEDAMAGEPLLDLAIARLDMLWAHGAEAMGTFTRRYAQVSGFNLDPLPYWDLWAATRPMGVLPQWAGGWPDMGRPDVTLALLTERHQSFVRAALQAS